MKKDIPSSPSVCGQNAGLAKMERSLILWYLTKVSVMKSSVIAISVLQHLISVKTTIQEFVWEVSMGNTSIKLVRNCILAFSYMQYFSMQYPAKLKLGDLEKKISENIPNHTLTLMQDLH